MFWTKGELSEWIMETVSKAAGRKPRRFKSCTPRQCLPGPAGVAVIPGGTESLPIGHQEPGFVVVVILIQMSDKSRRAT